jgi:hypothetical protein
LPVFKTSSIYGRQVSHEEDQVVWKYQEKAQWLERDNEVPGAYSNRGGGRVITPKTTQPHVTYVSVRIQMS